MLMPMDLDSTKRGQRLMHPMFTYDTSPVLGAITPRYLDPVNLAHKPTGKTPATVV